MSNPQKAKGTRFESALVKLARAVWRNRYGLRPYKPRQEGRNDVGDINASPFVIQAKAYKDLAEAVRIGLPAAQLQAQNAGEMYGVVAVKRARKSIAEALIGMDALTFFRVVLRLRRAEYLLQRADPEAYEHHADATLADLYSTPDADT